MRALHFIAALLLAFAAHAAPTASFTARPIQGSTCLVPCVVHFDAIGLGVLNSSQETDDTATTREFHSLLYEWDFGDPGSGNWATGAAFVSGQTLSKNTDRGPIAAHVYETAGTYTITLTVTNPSGQQSQTTRQITATAPASFFANSEIFCFANDDLDWTGCPLASGSSCTDDNCTVTTNWTTALTSGDDCVGSDDCANIDADGTRWVLFRRGDTFSQSAGSIQPANNSGPGLVSAFGSGARPIYDRNQNSFRNGGGWTWTEGHGIDGGNPGPLWSEGSDGGNNLTYVNWTEDDFTAASIDEITNNDDTVIGNRHAYVNMTLQNRASSAAYRMWPASRYGVLMGSSIDANGGTNDGSTMRTRHVQHWLFAHNTWINAPTSREHMQFRAMDNFGVSVPVTDQANKYVVVQDESLQHRADGGFYSIRLCVDSGCNCGLNAAPDCGGPGIGAGNIVDSRDFIFERNFISYDAGTPSDRVGIFEIQGGDVTIRNNVIDMQNGWTNTNQNVVNVLGEPVSFSTGSSADGNVHFYNNTIFFDETRTANLNFVGENTADGTGCPTGCFSRNNLMSAPGYSGTSGNGSNVTASNNFVTTSEPFIAAPPEQGLTDIMDFRLASPNASIIDAGYDFSVATDTNRWVYDDMLRNCRADGQWDIGAHEYNASSCPAFSGGSSGSSASGTFNISWRF